jgi:cytochrome c oxidase assembly factor CtaG
MVPKGKWYSVIISPHHRTDNWQLRIPGWGIWALGALLVVGCLALVSLGVVYRQYRIKAAEASRLRLQAQELAEATERIALLESELADLGEFQRHVREWLGLPPEVMVEATAFAPEAAWS